MADSLRDLERKRDAAEAAITPLANARTRAFDAWDKARTTNGQPGLAAAREAMVQAEAALGEAQDKARAADRAVREFLRGGR